VIKDRFKEVLAGAVSDAFRSIYPDAFKEVGETALFNRETVYEAFESPRDPSLGRFALPVFRQAALLKEKPPAISSRIAEETNKNLEGSGISCAALGGFVNATIEPLSMARETIPVVLSLGKQYGSRTVGKGKTYLIEYSSPNIAKPFSVGHLRTTVIGNSLRRLYKKLGYDVTGINYPGDWGTQFGKMIVAYRHWGDESTLEGNAVLNLVALYQRFHREVKDNPSLDDEARQAFKKLEQGDADTVALWKQFKTVSHAEFDRVYSALGVEFDLVIGESFFNDKMQAVIERLTRAGLTSVSEGALIVDIADDRLPPALLRKQDGATLYTTRDLAGLIYRWEKYKFEESLYIVGASQADHFKQCFKVIELLEEAENLPDSERMTGRVKHVEFGWVLFGGRAMATREGTTVLLDDVISKAIALAREKISEKNPTLPEIDRVAHQIGVGAIMFAQLSVKRIKDVNFVWEVVLNFDGDSGPYLQYTHARLCSLLRRGESKGSPDVDYSLLSPKEEQRVIELLADFPEVVNAAARQYEPVYIATYLFKLAAAFNSVYQRRNEEGKSDRIISENEALTSARLSLVKAVNIVLKEGLYLLGLESPNEM